LPTAATTTIKPNAATQPLRAFITKPFSKPIRPGAIQGFTNSQFNRNICRRDPRSAGCSSGATAGMQHAHLNKTDAHPFASFWSDANLFILFIPIIEGSLEGPPLSRHSDEPNTQKYSEARPSPAGVSMPGVLASIYVRVLDSET